MRVEYRVELDVYNGPLDLLLYLIKRDELDIYDIPIARITDSYMTYVAHAARSCKERGAGHQRRRRFSGDGGDADGDQVGDAAAQARRSTEGRASRRPPQELADPRYELVQQLLEYKRFKDAATLLERQQQEHESRFPRIPARREGEPDEPPPVDLEEVQVWDLLTAFDRLMKEVGVAQAALSRGHLRRHADRPARGRHRRPPEARREADAAAADRRPKEPQRNDRRVPGAAGTDPREEDPGEAG